MPDDLKRRVPEDPTKININQQWELDYWCEKLHCSEQMLRKAVRTVGPMVKDVKEWLKQHK